MSEMINKEDKHDNDQEEDDQEEDEEEDIVKDLSWSGYTNDKDKNDEQITKNFKYYAEKVIDAIKTGADWIEEVSVMRLLL